MEDLSFFSTQNYLSVFKSALSCCLDELRIDASFQTIHSFSFTPETNVKNKIVRIPHRGLLYLVLYDMMLENNYDGSYLVEDLELLQVSLDYYNIEAIRKYSLKYLQDLDRFNDKNKLYLIDDIKYYYQYTFLLFHELAHIWVYYNREEYLKLFNSDIIDSVKQWSIGWLKASGREGSYNMTDKEFYQLAEEIYCDMFSLNSIVTGLDYDKEDVQLLYNAIKITQSKQMLRAYLSSTNAKDLRSLIAFSPAQSIRMMTFISKVCQNKEMDRNLAHLPQPFVVDKDCKEEYLRIIQEGVNFNCSKEKIKDVVLAINDAEEQIIDGELSGNDIKVHCWLRIWNKL